VAIKHVVLDWNGTLCDMTDDSAIMKRLAVAALRGHLAAIKRGRVTRFANVMRFARGRVALSVARGRFSAGEASLAELYAPFNQDMLVGTPLDRVRQVSAEYGRDHAHLIDGRLLAPVLAARETGATLTIFSAANESGVRGILAAAGVAIDDLICNRLESANGNAVAFTAGHHTDKSGDFQREILDARGWLPEETVYSGDTDVDEPIARMLPAGNFIVPFLASGPFRDRMRAEHGATTPENAGDLSSLLSA
jgi:phosphoserine phosphatase